MRKCRHVLASYGGNISFFATIPLWNSNIAQMTTIPVKFVLYDGSTRVDFRNCVVASLAGLRTQNQAPPTALQLHCQVVWQLRVGRFRRWNHFRPGPFCQRQLICLKSRQIVYSYVSLYHTIDRLSIYRRALLIIQPERGYLTVLLLRGWLPLGQTPMPRWHKY